MSIFGLFNRSKQLYNRHRPVVALVERAINLSTDLQSEYGALQDLKVHESLVEWELVKYENIAQLQFELDALLEETKVKYTDILERGSRAIPFYKP